jgi:HPt (histidine-containing phosphotransfer) domain-containing protein
LAKPLREPDLVGVVERWLHLQRDQRDAFPDLFDSSVLEELVSVDPTAEGTVLSSLVGLFLTSVDERVGELLDAAQQEDATALSVAAHGLRGSCLQFGLRAAAEVAGGIEAQAKRGDTDGIGGVLSHLDVVLSHSRSGLDHALRAARQSLEEGAAGRLGGAVGADPAAGAGLNDEYWHHRASR